MVHSGNGTGAKTGEALQTLGEKSNFLISVQSSVMGSGGGGGGGGGCGWRSREEVGIHGRCRRGVVRGVCIVTVRCWPRQFTL